MLYHNRNRRERQNFKNLPYGEIGRQAPYTRGDDRSDDTRRLYGVLKDKDPGSMLVTFESGAHKGGKSPSDFYY